MAVRILWDEYETALLLDAYFQVQGGEISRKDAVANISRCLRNRAIAKGFDIDESWRNAIGISSQMGRIEMIFSPSEKTAKYPPKLFRQNGIRSDSLACATNRNVFRFLCNLFFFVFESLRKGWCRPRRAHREPGWWLAVIR